MMTFMEKETILHYLIIAAWLNAAFVDGKSVHGVFTSADAMHSSGQYVCSFCFHGNAMISYSLNTTKSSNPMLYLFLEDDWSEAKESNDCIHKLSLARSNFVLSEMRGNLTLPVFDKPRIWHIIYADALTCEQTDGDAEAPLPTPNYIQFELQLFNPDSLNNPTVHFSDEETGLFRFYQLLTVGYFVLFCIYGPRLMETLQKEGPMHLVIQLLTGAMMLQAVSSVVMMLHLRAYSKDGYGSHFFELISELFDVLSQFVMLYMLLSLSLGWTLGASTRSTQNYCNLLSRLQDKPAAKVVAILGVFQGILFVWEQYEEREHRMYHAHRSWAGVILVISRIALAAVFALNLYMTAVKERSALKRDFYSKFMRSCMLWFLGYPTLEVISWSFTSYFRYKFVTMSVVFCQSIAVIMLYKLFLSRSLYWEVSALSSTLLPLRMDRNFKHKMYS